MKWIVPFALAVTSLWLPAQESEQAPTETKRTPAPIAEMQRPVHVSATPILPRGTEVWLRLADEVKVKKVKVGDRVDFVLYRDLYYRNWLLARAGTAVEATVQQADKAKILNRGSNLVIVLQGLKLLNGQVLPLSGSATAQGGIGVGGQIAGGLLDTASRCSGWPCLLFDIPAVPTAAVLGVASKGENRNLKVDTSAPAFVDGDFKLDLTSLSTIEQSSTATGKVRIVRGVYGWPHARDLYCNGIALAHLNSKHKLEVDLKPGYYRFAIDPKKGAMEIFVNPASETNLLTDYEDVYELNEHDVSINTNKFMGKRNAGQLLKDAKPVEKSDWYGNQCQPLAEQIVP